MIPLAVSDMPSDYARYRPTANAGNGTIAAVQGASVEYHDMTTAHITDHSSATPARGGRGGSGGRSRRATGTALASVLSSIAFRGKPSEEYPGDREDDPTGPLTDPGD